MVRGAFPVPFLRLPKPPLTLTSGAIPRPRGVQPAFPCAAAAQEIPAWRRTPPQERIQYLFQYRSLLEEARGGNCPPYDTGLLSRGLTSRASFPNGLDSRYTNLAYVVTGWHIPVFRIKLALTCR